MFCVVWEILLYQKPDNGCLFSSLLHPSSTIIGTNKSNLILFILGFFHWAFEGWLRRVTQWVQWVAVYPTLVASFLSLSLNELWSHQQVLLGRTIMHLFRSPETSNSIPDKSIKEFLWNTYAIIPAGIILRSK